MSLVLSLCATTIYHTNSALCISPPLNISSPLIIISYIFIDLVIYSSSNTPHVYIYTQVPFSIIFCIDCTVPSLLVHLGNWLKQCVFVECGSFKMPDIHVVPLCAALRLRADLSAKPTGPHSCVFEVSVDEKATCHFGVSDFFFFLPSPPRDLVPLGSGRINCFGWLGWVVGWVNSIEGLEGVYFAVCLLKHLFSLLRY